jgi:hypothetical protein
MLAGWAEKRVRDFMITAAKGEVLEIRGIV